MSLNKSQALSLAKEYVLQRNVRAAIDIYREIIQADPSDLTAINTLGDLYSSTGMVQEATAQFTRVADGYIQGGATRKAIATLKKIIAVDPANAATAIKLADLYAQAGLPSEALQHYLRIATAYTRKGETLEALRIFGKIIELDPSNPSTRIQIGELYLAEGMNDQAFEAFVTAAGQLTTKGEGRRALNAYNEALSLRPDSVSTLAAMNSLAKMLGVDPDKIRRGPATQSVASGNLSEENSGQLTTDDLPPVPTSIHSEGADDFLVVQVLSRAERLVASGQVNQALTMLKDALTNKPDNIDVHVKLKDICLRTGMMAEAAHECSELARIYKSQGQDERSRDYTARANRLTQSLERPSGDLQRPEHKPVKVADRGVNASSIKLAPPPINLPTPPEIPEKIRQNINQPVADRPQPTPMTISVVPPAVITPEPATIVVADRPQPAPMTISVVPPAVITPEPATIVVADQDLPTNMTIAVAPPAAITPEPATVPADLPPALPQDYVATPQQVFEEVLEPELSAESDLEASSQSYAMAEVAPILSYGTLPVASNRSRLRATAVAATVLALAVAGAVIAGFSYNSHLDKQYQSLAQVAPAVVDPPSPPVPTSEPNVVLESDAISVDVTPTLQTETTPRLTKLEAEMLKKDQQRAAAQAAAAQATATQPAQTQPAREAEKAITRPSQLPPRISVNPDGQAYTENRTPAGLAGDVPVTAAHPAEPPPKPVRRSAGVVSGVAVFKANPVYPKAARESQQTGVVAVEITINEQGAVTSARAVSGPPLLRNAAESAARAWRFKPSLLGGVPVTTTSTITFNFKL